MTDEILVKTSKGLPVNNNQVVVVKRSLEYESCTYTSSMGLPVFEKMHKIYGRINNISINYKKPSIKQIQINISNKTSFTRLFCFVFLNKGRYVRY